MSVDKYPSIFSCQMATIVYVFLILCSMFGHVVKHETLHRSAMLLNLFAAKGGEEI